MKDGAFFPINEGFSNYIFPGTYPLSDDKVLLDDYPQKGINETSNNNYNQIWWKYPVFSLGSYEQITNNLRYYDNPDQGTCIRADFCGALYDDKQNKKSNIVQPLLEEEPLWEFRRKAVYFI